MSKSSRQHLPNPNAEVRIALTPREFKDLQGLCAIAAIALMTIKQQADAAIAAAQAPQQKELARLAKKYRDQGMRADHNYRFDVATHSLVAEQGTR